MATNTGLQGALLHLRWLQLGLVDPIIYSNHLSLSPERSKTWNQRSLHHVSVACLPNKPLRVLATKAPRVFHIGAWWARIIFFPLETIEIIFSSGLHNKGKADCQEAAQKTWEILEKAEPALFPERWFLPPNVPYQVLSSTKPSVMWPVKLFFHPTITTHNVPCIAKPFDDCLRLEVLRTGSRKLFKLKQGNGGWGDVRDHQLCLNISMNR